MVQTYLTTIARQVSTDDKVILAVLVLIFVFLCIKYEEQIKDAWGILLVVGGGLAVLYGLVKFVRWAWYN